MQKHAHARCVAVVRGLMVGSWYGTYSQYDTFSSSMLCIESTVIGEGNDVWWIVEANYPGF